MSCKKCKKLIFELNRQKEYWESLPSGIDEDANENLLQGIEDMVAHIGGIAVRKITEALKEVER